MNIPEERLTEHFTLHELCVTEHRNIDNTPDPVAIQNLHKLAGVLETIRSNLNDNVLIVTSGYRSPVLNLTVGSKQTSAHLLGLAADFNVRGFGPPLEVAKAIAAMHIPGIDQIISEFDRWVHVGLPRPGLDPRHQKLTIDAFGTREGFHEARMS